MPFIKELEKYKSLSIVGLEKNTGKTECLNYVLSRLSSGSRRIALTSIGVDGENRDQVKNTHKPEIMVYEGMIFVTPEFYYRKRKVVSEILDVTTQSTCLGRLVTARAKSSDKVMISGPVSNRDLKVLIEKMNSFDVDLTIIDGALSRKSLGSPAVTDAMILATGAALSANIPQLVYKTQFMYDLINLPQIEEEKSSVLGNIENGIWAITAQGKLVDLMITSVLMVDKVKDRLFKYGNQFYVSGAVTDKFLSFLKSQKQIKEIELIVRDFTRIFSTPETFYSFRKSGGTVRVVQKTKLVAVCINPVSPDGYHLNSEELIKTLESRLLVPVYDVKKL